MTFHQGTVLSCSVRSLINYLLLATSLQIALVRCQDISTMQDGLTTDPVEYTCTPACGVGYECELGWCQRQQCSTNCSDVAMQLVCGSNGVTYNNMCELERARCELAYDIKVYYTGACMTASPPPDQNCSRHQKRFDDDMIDIVKRCNLEKYVNGTLDQNELDNCYRPQCDHHSFKYLIKQCTIFLTPQWCWCSSPDGHTIQGTFQQNMPKDYCSNRHKCTVDGITHDDGAVFTTSSVCGRCECLNGTHTCFVEWDVDASGRLSNDSLENLKKQLIQVFNFQYNHNDHAIVDIRHVYKYPTEVSESQKETLLGWKFNHYDKNQDDEISISEEHNFHSDLQHLFGCNKYFDYLSEQVDKNGDTEITMEEWKDFFHIPGAEDEAEVLGELSQPVKRDTAPRKPLQLRKKFHYVLY